MRYREIIIPSFIPFLIFFLLFGVSNEAYIQNECKNDIMVGDLQINNKKATVEVQTKDGLETIFVAQAGGNTGGVLVNKTSVTIQNTHRTYYGKDCPKEFKEDMYRRFKLLGGWISFKVDVSNIGCACNGAIYFSHMPGYDESGKPDPTKGGDYWCDANCVMGEFCPEMDLMEANNHALAITPHQCDKPQNKHYPKCDRGGCARNLFKDIGHNVYGPGEEFVINSLFPFSMNYSFHADGNGKLFKIETVLLGKGGKSLTIVHNDTVCGENYLESMTDPLNQGMVLVAGNWGKEATTMAWLDVPPCTLKESCNRGAWTFWDLKVYENNIFL